MDLKEAQELLAICERRRVEGEGDRGLQWFYGESLVAYGFFGQGIRRVEIFELQPAGKPTQEIAVFEDDDASSLLRLGSEPVTG